MVLYNGLDERFFGIVDKQQFLLQNNEINSIKQSGILIFTSVANLVPYKDYFTIFKALEQLKNKGYQFYYLIIGEGPDRSAIENDIREKDLEKNVVLLGRRHDVKEILSISDVFIHSSRGEGCSNAIIEAMASALPVVATDTGGTNEIVQSDHGFLFDYGDHQTLVRCLTEIMEKPELLLKMGSISRERAMKFFSTERMVDEFNKIVQEVSGQKIDKPKDNI
ncbi:MAG: glycosyltransferase family 4 protein [Bacteroidetes bacterium]|nr:glycosyltransferase family 4 protein [Bacteroidota bacterium]